MGWSRIGTQTGRGWERGSVGKVRVSWQESWKLGAQTEEAMEQIQAGNRGSSVGGTARGLCSGDGHREENKL